MASDKNEHIKEYLTYYLSLAHSPNYAVMLTGPWGIGKTYVAKDFLRRVVEGKKKYVYVSLFGLSTIDEIDEAVFQAIYPFLAEKATKIGARVFKTLLKRTGFDPQFKLDEVLNRFNAEIYVFDDLERCEAPINKVLGYINQFVEHEGCKVLILANEKEISDDADYARRREKLIGKTLEVQSAFEDAFNYFISSVDDPSTKSLFKKNASDIDLIYAQSKLNNLRILQQTMWDFERFSSALTTKHRKTSEAMTALLRLFFALSFELKAGRIKSSDLNARSGLAAAMAAHLSNQKSSLTLARERYPEIDLNDTLLADDVLVDCLVRGIVNPHQIRLSLDRSRFFVSVANEPAWRTVWYWTERMLRVSRHIDVEIIRR